jgi:uracil-DNA glycosylase family 4
MIHNKSRKLRPDELECTACNLHKTCVHTNKMDASGSKAPTFLICGEAPGASEDKNGVQFVGKAGELLRNILKELDYKDVAFDNSVKCWTGKGNPTPTPAQIKACRPYLLENIKRLKPKVIIMLGASALKAVSGKTGITKLRGTAWDENGIIYLPTFHPSATFYDPEKLRWIVEDLEKAKEYPTKGLPKPEEVNWSVAQSFDEAMGMIKSLYDYTLPHFDIETSTNIPWDRGAKILGYSACDKPGEAWFVPLFHKEAPYSEGRARILLQEIRKAHEYRIENELPMAAYNAVFDLMFLKVVYDIDFVPLGFDPYIAHHLLSEEMAKPSLSQLTWMYTDIGGYDSEIERLKKEQPQLYLADRGGTFENFDLQMLGTYGAGDVDASKRLELIFTPRLHEEGLWDLFKDISLQATYPIIEYIKNGVKIDGEFLGQLIDTYQERMNSILMDCRELPDVKKWEKREYLKTKRKWEGEEKTRLEDGKRPRKKPDFFVRFKPKDADIRGVLFDTAGLKPVKETTTGLASVDKEVREELYDRHPLIPLVDDHTRFQTWYSRYANRYKKSEDYDYIFHPSYDLTGTKTGRLVGDLQQLPRSDKTKDIKRLFISRFGNKGNMLSMDVKHAEIRVFSCESKDKNLIRIFKEGRDPHIMAACDVFGYDYEEFLALYKDGDENAYKIRTDMKSAVSFGVPYGREAKAVAEDFGWSEEKARKFIRDYFNQYPGIKEFIVRTRMFASEYGYTTTLLGRKRRVPQALRTSEVPDWERERALRQLVNHVIQGGMHDIFLYATVQIFHMFKAMGLESKMCGEVHDSLIIDYLKDELDTILEILTGVFEILPERFPKIIVPMEIEVQVGPNLIDMEQILG